MKQLEDYTLLRRCKMDYKSIIQDNIANHSTVKWWPNYAYHYTDISNAVGILRSRKLYSRTNAQKYHLMNNDNASKKVIDITNTKTIDSVRLYFRPLTPTQYYNEGFKHKDLRFDGDEYANVPVPIFFVFSLEKLLNMPTVKFSECSQAGTGSPLKSGVEGFSKLDFDKIYSNGYSDNFEELKKYRHAEIVCLDSLDISSCLYAIICRNAIEKESLLNMLKNTDLKVYTKYKNIVNTCTENMFQGNGLFITSVNLFNNILTFSFSDSYNKEHYKNKQMEKLGIKTLPPIRSRLELEWTNQRKELYYKKTPIFELNYDEKNMAIKLPIVESATILHIRLFFENSLMCDIERSINNSQMV